MVGAHVSSKLHLFGQVSLRIRVVVHESGFGGFRELLHEMVEHKRLVQQLLITSLPGMAPCQLIIPPNALAALR